MTRTTKGVCNVSALDLRVTHRSTASLQGGNYWNRLLWIAVVSLELTQDRPVRPDLYVQSRYFLIQVCGSLAFKRAVAQRRWRLSCLGATVHCWAPALI